ncbi:hypothetical protein M409DRAFT_15815 [Zasmidium cellare ATCC 36951]|uniref:Uncharacterized protein n=1 Tax=Zasmidium cellare ATCC 36951 TaxID=1080233 RepID=A0A6A6D3A5_ZASCE|nr:uncharacterized protein M409DRAFT_15815 [Zasmidium cellare ATCC 36951]KAF2173535.1 hypothetical protein M409DRAFT_15815 [Zasmidium cellare ATCC 36951]
MSMPQHRQLQDQQACATEDWLLIEDSSKSSGQGAPVDKSQEIDLSDMTGLLASMKLQCTELAKAQHVIEQVLERQAHEIESQKQQLSELKDELDRSLEEHMLDMQQRLTEKILEDCDALRTELRRELASDIGRLQNEIEKILQMLDDETKQRQREVEALELDAALSQQTQQQSLDDSDKRIQRLQKHIATVDNPGGEAEVKRPAGEQRDKDTSRDHDAHRASMQWSMFCDDCRKEMNDGDAEASKNSWEGLW